MLPITATEKISTYGAIRNPRIQFWSWRKQGASWTGNESFSELAFEVAIFGVQNWFAKQQLQLHSVCVFSPCVFGKQIHLLTNLSREICKFVSFDCSHRLDEWSTQYKLHLHGEYEIFRYEYRQWIELSPFFMLFKFSPYQGFVFTSLKLVYQNQSKEVMFFFALKLMLKKQSSISWT